MNVFPEPGSAKRALLIYSASESVDLGKAALADGEYVLAQGLFSAARQDLAAVGRPDLVAAVGALEQFARVLAEAREEPLDG